MHSTPTSDRCAPTFVNGWARRPIPSQRSGAAATWRRSRLHGRVAIRPAGRKPQRRKERPDVSAPIAKAGFTGLRRDEIDPLLERDEMTDEEMVAYLSRCQLGPEMPRSSIETLLHAFIPFAHVDHTHPDATNMICCAENGEQLAKELWGDEAVWIPYIRPGFALSKQVGEAVRNNPQASLILLAKHGLVTWGETGEESYIRTIEAINKAADFVNDKAHGKNAFGGVAREAVDEAQSRAVLATVL